MLLLLLFLTLPAHADENGLTGEATVVNPPNPVQQAPLVIFTPSPDAPDISGVPQAPEGPGAPTTADEVRNAPGADEPECKSKVDPALRAMVFRHYQNFQAMQNAQGNYFPDTAPQKCAHLLGMVMKESAGDPTDVTDMKGREVGTYRAMTTVDRWKALFDHGNLVYDKQTNYGLAQQSMDTMLAGRGIMSKLAGFFGKGGGTQGQDVRKLLSLYQDFAQGRLSQKDGEIPQKLATDPNAPAEVKARVREGLRQAVWHCGTRFLFKEGYAGADGEKALEDAMATIAYCDVGEKNPDPKNQAQAKCFARWVTLCPALNVDIAVLSPDSYFATRNTPPLCQATFQKLTKTAPKK